MSMHWPECDSNPREFFTPGVPPNPLPFWEDFSLQQKLPVPSKPPRGAIVLLNGRKGYSRWKRQGQHLDFDLTDPNNYKYPATNEYDPLFDIHLRGYMASHRVRRLLRQRGLTNRDGNIKCNLLDYNRYRLYLHDTEAKTIKANRAFDEPRLLRELMSTTLESVEIAQGGELDLRIQYSGILRSDAKSILNINDEALVDDLAEQGYVSGEQRWLRWFNRLLQEDCRKIALLRLRRIQKYRDSQMKACNDWRSRNEFDMKWLAEEKLKREELDVERAIHVKQHIKLSAVNLGKMQKRIDECSELRRKAVERASLAVQRHVCIESHRQWALSARCPKDIVKGVDKPCHLKDPWENAGNMVSAIFPEGSENTGTKAIRSSIGGTPKATASGERGQERGQHKDHVDRYESGQHEEHSTSQQHGQAASRSGSKITILVQHAVKRAIDLVAATHGAAVHHLNRTGSLVNPSAFIEHIESAMRDEAGNLVIDAPDVQLAVADYIMETAIAEKASHLRDKLSDWDGAPALRPSTSATGLYVSGAITQVMEQLQDEGLVSSGMREVAAGTCVARAGTDAALHPDVVATPSDDSEMLALAVRILRDRHQSLPDGDSDTNWKQLGAGLVASLVRVAIVAVRKALQRGQVGDAELGMMAHSAGEFGNVVGDVVGHDRESRQLNADPPRVSHQAPDYGTRQSIQQAEDGYGIGGTDSGHTGGASGFRKSEVPPRPEMKKRASSQQSSVGSGTARSSKSVQRSSTFAPSESMTRMIADVTESSGLVIDDEVRKRIAHSAQEFIKKTINELAQHESRSAAARQDQTTTTTTVGQPTGARSSPARQSMFY